MNFITPPTDSLYKFLCISGLLLLVFSFYRMDTLIQADRSRVRDLLKTALEDSTRAELILKNKHHIGVDSAWGSLTESIIKRRAGIRVAKELDNDLDHQIKIYERYSLFGFFCFIIGFLLWHHYIQRHHDFLLLAQVVEAKEKLPNDSPARSRSTDMPTPLWKVLVHFAILATVVLLAC